MNIEKMIIVSDIHSNIYALNKLLDYINKYDVKAILNCGDFMQIGPNPCEVFDIVMNDRRFLNILGNNDLSLIERNLMDFRPNEKEHQDWVIARLGSERIEKLKALPRKLTVEINGVKFLMVHTRLESMIDLPVLYHGKPIEEYTTDYGEDCDYVLLGHTHFQSFVSHWKGKTVINAGSLGCSKDNTISFITAEIKEDEISFDFKKVRYDTKPVIEDLRKFNVPDAENIINFFFT